MFLNKCQKVLILAPHTDDGELGCGGTISKLIKMNKEVYYCAFSTCEKSLPYGFCKDTLKQEVMFATEKLGIKKENVFIYNFEVREFKRERQEILEELVKLNKKLNPDLIFTPSLKDIHQDHITISEEAIRSFKKKNVLGYEVLWNDFSLENNCFIEINEDDLIKKIEALKQYKSQYHRSYVSEEFIRSLAVVRGVQGRSKLAETFEIIRLYL